MPAPARPRRSVLYMPGSKPRALEKARHLPADALILDLEDAVAPAEKAAARDLVRAEGRSGAFGGREVVIRVNGLGTEWGDDDLAAAAAAGPDAVLVPKAESAAQIAEVAARLREAGAPERVAIWAMIETPRGVLRAEEIAGAPGMAAFVLGTNDLMKDLRAAHTPAREPVATALGWSLLAARAHGLACIDGVHNAIRDEVGLRRACEQGRAMGFDGKTLIHPDQLAIANAEFGPTEAELAEAREIVAAFEAAKADGAGVTVVGGRIVEQLHAETAERLIAEAAAIAALHGQTMAA